MLAEAAGILGIPATRVKNWTIGRPLKISPSIGATGTGSRNLYDRCDLYRLAIAAQLGRDGFAARAIQSVLDQLGTAFVASVFAVVTTGDGHVQWRKEGQLHVRVVSRTQYEREGWGVVHGPVSRSLGCYVLNVVKITETVDGLAERYVKGKAGTFRSSVKPPVKQAVDFFSTHRKFRFDDMK